jgi:RNA polymerase sigma-70 factor (ECF subfamily)
MTLAGDPALLAGFREGRREVLERIYRDHVRAVEGYVRVLARASRAHHFAQSSVVADLVQDIFVRAFSARARASYDGLREFGPYLMTIARNCFVDLLRSSGREVPKSDDELVRLVEDATPAPEAFCDARTLEILNAFVAGLSADLRAVYEQRFVEGKSQIEAADALSITRRAVRTAEGHLRTGLRKALVRAGIRLSEIGGPPEKKPARELTGSVVPDGQAP